MELAPIIVGHSRAVNKPGEYAILPQGNRCFSPLPYWEKATSYVLASPERGAQFTQIEIFLEPEGKTTRDVEDGLEQFLYLREGEAEIILQDQKQISLQKGGYIWLPPHDPYRVVNSGDQVCDIIWIRKRYQPLEGAQIPARVSGQDQDLELYSIDTHTERRLFPYREDMGFDMGIKILYFEKGVYFSFVESHVQEHGLVMLEGRGLYYLNGDYHEVEAGDFIYMAPYCLQFMVPLGEGKIAYLLYKDLNRDYIQGL